MSTRHTILVVDDERDVVKSVYDLLRLDYKVLQATNATEAMRLMETNDVHVVMSDQRMPDMTGVALLQTIRERFPRAIRLLFTGYADIKAVVEAINTGHVYRYINKPWDPDELMVILKEAVDRYELIGQRDQLLVDLKSRNEELARANELKTAFIRVASHELRTPLTILLGLAKLGLKQSDSAPSMAPILLRIDLAALRLQKLIDQIITMLASQRFELSLDRSETNLASLIRQAGEDIRPFVDMRNQVLQIDTPSSLGIVNVDENKIRECINHLLLNAIKFTPDGGTITLSAAQQDHHVDIRVSDNGNGIPLAEQEHLFTPFFTQSDVSTHSSGTYEFGKRGLGLGLSVVKAFVELHGGNVSVQSNEGKGSTFIIKLPLVESENES